MEERFLSFGPILDGTMLFCVIVMIDTFSRFWFDFYRSFVAEFFLCLSLTFLMHHIPVRFIPHAEKYKTCSSLIVFDSISSSLQVMDELQNAVRDEIIFLSLSSLFYFICSWIIVFFILGHNINIILSHLYVYFAGSVFIIFSSNATSHYISIISFQNLISWYLVAE